MIRSIVLAGSRMIFFKAFKVSLHRVTTRRRVWRFYESFEIINFLN